VRKILIVAAAALSLGLVVVALGAAGGQAQEGDGPFGSFLSKVADKLGVSEDELRTAIDEARDETIDEAVEDGRLTEEEAERLKERDGLFPPFGFGPFVCHRVGGFLLEAADTVLDADADAIKEQLRDGSSLAEIAEAEGMSVDEFKAAFLEQIKAQLNEKVAENEHFTQEMADNIYSRTEEHIDDIVNGTPGDGPCGHFGPGRFHRPFRGDGFFEEPAEPEAETSDVTA
jgi:AraC-like DNA-binding protein